MKKFYFGFIIVGLILSCLSLYGIFGPKKEYLTTQGTIVSIIEDYDATDDSFISRVLINYEVNGIKYEDVEYGAYDSSMKVGDQVTVYYEEENPTHIQAEGYTKVPYVVLPFALLSTIGGIIAVIKK